MDHVLIGGPNHGQTVTLDNAPALIKAAVPTQDFRVTSTAGVELYRRETFVADGEENYLYIHTRFSVSEALQLLLQNAREIRRMHRAESKLQ